MIAKCPYCKFAYTIMPEHIGLTSVCQNCQHNFVIAEDVPEYAAPPQAPMGGQGRPGGEFAGAGPYQAKQEAAAPPTGKLSRTMAKAQAKAKAKEEAAAKAEAKRLAKAQGKSSAALEGSASGGKVKILGLLLLLVLLGGAAFYMLVHQPLAHQAAELAQTNTTQTAKINGLNRQLGQLQKDQGQVEELKALRQELRNYLEYYSSEMAKYPADAIYHQLAASVVAETKLVDLLVLARINALESGAKIEATVALTAPNEALAQELLLQMDELSQHMASAEKLIDPNDNSMLAQEQRLILANEGLNLATLRRSYYTAKYGLGVPYSLSAAVDRRMQEPSAQQQSVPQPPPQQ